jgi:hypothetical protein
MQNNAGELDQNRLDFSREWVIFVLASRVSTGLLEDIIEGGYMEFRNHSLLNAI